MTKRITKENLLSRKLTILSEKIQPFGSRMNLTDVHLLSNGYLKLIVRYEGYPTFDIMRQLSEVFETKDINIGSEIPGCDTCGHGKGVFFHILNVDVHPPITSNMKNLTEEEMGVFRSGNIGQVLEMISSRLGITWAHAGKILDLIQIGNKL